MRAQTGACEHARVRASGITQLTAVELQAMRLDGDLFSFGPWVAQRYRAAEEPHDTVARASAIAAEVPAGVVVTGSTAAWVYDGLCPGDRMVVIAYSRRGAWIGSDRFDVRFSHVPPAQRVNIGGLALTTFARTLVEVAVDPDSTLERIDELLRSPIAPTWASMCDEVAQTVHRRHGAGLLRARLNALGLRLPR